MRTIQCARAGGLVAALGACVLIAGAAQADVATERPGSILIFPKVVRDGTRNTLIQITNTGNLPEHVRCFYLNAQTSPTGRQLCGETDFFLDLTSRQPTHWDVAAGRAVDPFDGETGLDPGSIPPVPVGFTGALVCAEVDSGDMPVALNALKGEATLSRVSGDDISIYNAIAVQGNNTPGANDGNNRLQLDNAEYNACPASSLLNFVPDGANDTVIEAFGNGGTCSTDAAACNNDSNCSGTCDTAVTNLCTNAGAVARMCMADTDCGVCDRGQSSVRTNLTLLPCNLDFNTNRPTTIAVNFFVTDEFEVPFSGGTTFSCWTSFNIGDIFNLRSIIATPSPGALATQFATVRIIPSTGGPVVGVAEAFHIDSVGNTGAAATNLHTQGVCIPLSAPPRGCTTNADCTDTSPTCQLTSPASIILADH